MRPEPDSIGPSPQGTPYGGPQPPRAQLIRFPSLDTLTRGAARRLLTVLKHRPPSPLPFTLALSGGRIAPPFYDALVTATGPHRSFWDEVHFFFADERCVPLDAPESNFRTAELHLLGPLGIPTRHTHPFLTSRDPEFAAAQAQAEVLRCTARNPQGTPQLDLIILGMGEDGHVASLFPAAGPEIAHSHRVFLPVTSPKPPPHRLTLSYAVLAAARAVWVLVSGPGKADALRRSLLPGGDTPLGRVVQSRRKTDLFVESPDSEGAR